MNKVIHASGTRKRAIARVTLKSGSGTVMINNVGLQHYGSKLNRDRIKEPIILAGKDAQKYDYHVNVSGGGTTGQADAVRLAIGRALAQTSDKVKSTFADYDRMLLVADVRRKEPKKPNTGGNARAKTQKSYR